MKRFTAAFAALALFAIPLAAQTPSYGEKVDVNVVLIDAVVTDSTGNQILGLTKDDFVVTEDGRPVTVESIDWAQNQGPPARGPGPRARLPAESLRLSARWRSSPRLDRPTRSIESSARWPTSEQGSSRLTLLAQRSSN